MALAPDDDDDTADISHDKANDAADDAEASDLTDTGEGDDESQPGYEAIEFYGNLADTADGAKLFTKYFDLYERDKAAREKRDEIYEEGIRRTGLGGDAPGGAAFDGASKVVHPGLTEACIDFCARAMKELFPAAGPVKTKIDGKPTRDKADRAERKRRHMNYQLTREIPEYRNILEQVLTQTPLGGSQFIKLYPDFQRKRPAAEFVRIDSIYLPYAAGDFYTAQRVTHRQLLTEYEFERRVTSGMYRDVDFIQSVSDPDITRTQSAMDKVEGKTSTGYNEDGLREVLEVYAYDDMEDNDQVAPYILSLDTSTGKLLSLYRNWEEGDDTFAKMDWLVKFGFLPWDGPLEIGLPHVIGGLSAAATGGLRALLDSAHIANSATALVLKGSRVSGQNKKAQPTQLIEIQAGAGIDDIRKVAQPMPFPGPSQVLFQLLQFIDTQMRGVVRTALDSSAEDDQNMPVGTKMANIEQGLVVYSSIHARMHASQGKLLEVLHRINKMYMDDYDPEMGFATREDYEADMDVQPVSDPNVFSDFQRAMQNQLLERLSTQMPALYDIRALHRRQLMQAHISDIDELMPEPKKHQDQNPATENIMMAMGQPAMVMPDQDHLAHLQVLLDFMQSPVLGAAPMVQPTFAPHAVEHAKQHILFYYGDLLRQKIEAAMGVPIKDIQDEDPEIAKKLSACVAAASPAVMSDLQSHMGGALPIIQQALQFVQSMQPPQPQDPVAAQLQQAQIVAQSKQAEIEAESQNVQSKSQASIEVAKIRSSTELEKNREDNATALEIARMREAAGDKIGNVKDGTDLGNSFAEGGLVEAKPQSHGINLNMTGIEDAIKNMPPPQVHFDMAPIAAAISEAVKSQPAPHVHMDMTPVSKAIAAIPAPVAHVDLSGVEHAIRSQPQPQVHVDMSPLHEALSQHADKVQGALGSMAGSINGLSDTVADGHKKIMGVVKKPRKPAKIKIERDKDGKPTGAVMSDDGE